MDYPQRWLKEHKAVPSAEGWRRSTTKELLKSQKGLDNTFAIFKSCDMINVPRIVIVEHNQKAVFEYDYVIDEHDYKPTSIVGKSINSNYNFIFEADDKLRKIKCIGDIYEDGASDMFQLFIEGQRTKTTYKTVYFSLNKPNPTFNRVYAYGANTIHILDTGNVRGIYGYRVYDTILDYSIEDVEVYIEYEGDAILTPNIKSYNEISNIIEILGSGLKDGEIVKSYVVVKGIKSNVETMIARKLSKEDKLYDEMTDEEKYEYHSNM